MALIDEFGEGWYNQLKPAFGQPWWTELHQKVKQRYQHMRPEPRNMFRAFKLTPYEKLKVVLIGQDPYPSIHANGLAFSSDCLPMPKSLEIIFKELKLEYNRAPESGNLNFWAEQGVLLLNTALSVDDGMPGSHAGFGWEHFTTEVLNAAVKKTGMILVAWGKPAINIARPFNNKAKVLSGYHPMVEHYSGGAMKFLGNNHFITINQLLKQSNKEPISWIT